MDEQQKKELIQLIKNNQPVPEEYEDIFFPTTKKEYELKYAEKQRKEVILNDTMSVPFQAVKHFGNIKDNGWANMLIFGDNLQALKHLLKLKNEGKLKNSDGINGVRLVYIDPPFATKEDFEGSQDQKAYSDKLSGANFIEFLRKRIILLREIMSDDGTILVHLDWKKSHYIKVIMDEIFGENNFRSEIIYKRTPGHHLAKGLDFMTDSIFYYTKGINCIFNQQYQDLSQEELDEKFPFIEKETGRRFTHEKLEQSSNAYSKAETRIIDGKKVTTNLGWRWTQDTFDQRIKENPYLIFWTKEGKPRYKRYADEYEGRKIGNLWDDIVLISSNSSESVGYPTQKPESLLQRIILKFSNKKDIVLDCFAGSGTTGAVAEKLDRKWIMVDCGKLAIYTIQKRMMNLKEEIGDKGKNLKPKPFVLYHSGLYHDGELLEKMKENDYTDFVLELFGCQKRNHIINGLEMHGTLNNHSVMIFNKQHYLTYEFIDDLQKLIGSAIKDTLYIIAPVGVVGFNEDIVPRGNINYEILRIPNSLIEQIKDKNFIRLKQPRSSNDINQTIDSVGFDFIYPPHVKANYRSYKPKDKLLDNEYAIEIREFDPVQIGSKIIEFKDSKSEALSMIMIDFSYDGDTFNLDKYYFGDEISKNNFIIKFDDEIIDKIMVIYLDIFGNERKEIVKKEEFVGR